MGVQFLPHAVGESIWGIDEDEVEERGVRAGGRCTLATRIYALWNLAPAYF